MQEEGPNTHTYNTLTVLCGTLDKVTGNYTQDLARNLQTDTSALCGFSNCVSTCVCARREHVCPLERNSAFFKNLLHKAHSGTPACLFKQTLDWVSAGQESFLKYITTLSLARSLSGQCQRRPKVDPCLPSLPPSTAGTAEKGHHRPLLFHPQILAV